MENLSLALSLFNQYNFATAKANIGNIEYYFQCNPSTQGNQLIEELVNAIKTYDFDAVGEPLFKAILMKCKKNEQESQAIMAELIQWKKCSKEQIQPAAKYLQDICAAAVIQKANRLYEKSPSEYLKYLKNVNFQMSGAEVFSSVAFDKVDINTIIAEQNDDAVSTNVRLMNDAFAAQGGLPRSQIVSIMAAPGVGKTLMGMNLALWMASHGEKVLYCALADVNMKDFIIRMGSIGLGISFVDAYRNIGAVYESLRKMVGSNLEICIAPSGIVSADDIVEKVINENFTVSFVDYDSCLRGAGEGESMYSQMGNIYNTFTRLKEYNKLTFLMCQPKVYVYNQLIGLGDMGESSKKAQIVDMVFAISNNAEECPNHLYTLSIPKCRRGKVGGRAYAIRIEGRFIEIPKGVYDQLKCVTEEKNYTEAEIQDMINRYNMQYQHIQQSIQTAQQTPASPNTTNKNHLKSPFG